MFCLIVTVTLTKRCILYYKHDSLNYQSCWVGKSDFQTPYENIYHVRVLLQTEGKKPSNDMTSSSWCVLICFGEKKNHTSPTSFIFDSNQTVWKLKCVVADEPQLSSLFVSVHFNETFYLAVSKLHKTQWKSVLSEKHKAQRVPYTGAVTLIPVLNKWSTCDDKQLNSRFLRISQVSQDGDGNHAKVTHLLM